MHAIQEESACPDALAESIPGTPILDNDELKDDTCHRTILLLKYTLSNIMFSHIKLCNEFDAPIRNMNKQSKRSVMYAYLPLPY